MSDAALPIALQGLGLAAGAATASKLLPNDAAPLRAIDLIQPFRPIIWDTDWWTDPDDVTDARVLAWAERVGLIDIRAVSIDTNYSYSPASLDAVFTYDGRADIAISVPLTPHVPDGSPAHQLYTAVNYTNRGLLNSNCPPAPTVWRQVIASSTQPVDIICSGYLNNVQEFLQSPADDISPLTGIQLVQQNGGRLWVMGGVYPGPGIENNFARTPQAVASAQYVCQHWPTGIIFAGYEVGGSVLIAQHLQITNPLDVVAAAYNQNGAHGGRPAWGAMHVLLACYDDFEAMGYTTVRGTNVVAAGSGENTFTPNFSGNHYYVVKTKSDGWYAKRINDLLLLPTQPAPAPSRLVYLDGKWQAAKMQDRTLGASQVAQPSGVTATVDVENLFLQCHSDDVAEVGDGGAVISWRNRAGPICFRRPATNSGMAVYKASVGGKSAVTFATNNFYTTQSFRQSVYMTVYAHVYITNLAAANIIVACDTNTGNGTRQWHCKVAASGAAQAAYFTQASSGATDTSSATMTTGVWKTVVWRFRQDLVEALIDGAGGSGGTARPWPICANMGKISLASQVPNATVTPLIGSLRELRIYNAWHDDSTVAAVIAEMT